MIGTCQLLSNRNSVQVMDSRTPSTRTDWSKMNQGGITDFGDDETEELPETPFNEDRLADLDFGNDTIYIDETPLVTNDKLCHHQTSIHDDLLHEHEMMSR